MHTRRGSTDNIAQSTMSEAHAFLYINILNLIRLGFSRKQMWFAAVDSSSQFFTLFRKLQSNDALLLPLLTAWRTFSKDALASQTSGANTTLNRSWTPQIQQSLVGTKIRGSCLRHISSMTPTLPMRMAWKNVAIFQHSSFYCSTQLLRIALYYSCTAILWIWVIVKSHACSTSPKHPLSSCLCLCACVPCCLCHGCQNWETADKRNGVVCSATYMGDHLAVNISFPVWVQDVRETNHLSDIIYDIYVELKLAQSVQFPAPVRAQTAGTNQRHHNLCYPCS